MARGSSGRIVLEIDPEFKKSLYLALEKNQKTLKDWFLLNAEQFINDHEQPALFISENIKKYRGKDKKRK